MSDDAAVQEMRDLGELLSRYRKDNGTDYYQTDANTVSSMRPGSGLRNVAFYVPRADTIVIKSEHAVPSRVDFPRLDHAISGLCSEAGELAEHLKHVRFHGKALDVTHVMKELGDVLWYVAEATTAISSSIAYIMARNIYKLAKRYPEGYFTVARSENRDTSKE